MRRVIYKALVAAPAKVFGGLSALAGLIASVWPEKIRALVGDGFPAQTVGIALLATAAGYFFLLWLLKPVHDSEGGSHQSTSGPLSHAIQAGRDVHIHSPAPPAERQARKSPYGTWDDRNLAGLARAMRGGLSGSRISPQVERIMRQQRERCPEMAIGEALRQISERIGDEDEQNGFPEARRQFRQSALEGRLDVWGQRQIPPSHFQDNRRSEVWTRVEASHWEDHRLHPLAANLTDQDAPHTEEEDIGRISERYWNLKVRPEEVRRRWPLRLPADDQDDDGDNWKTV